MSDQPVSAEVAELREEQALEAAYTAAMRETSIRQHKAAAFRQEAVAHVLNALAWLIAVAMIVGTAYVATVIL